MHAPVAYMPSVVPTDVHAFFPGIVSARYNETWDFYTDVLGFRTVDEWDTFVHLEHPCGARISILREETDEESSELVSATDGRGLWLNLEVADLDAEYLRLAGREVTGLSSPEQRPTGERRFVLRDPNGILIFVTQRRPALRFQ